MANAVEFVPDQAKTEAVEAHVIWMTTGLGLRWRLGRHDLGRRPEPRGHRHPGDPRDAEGDRPQPGARLRERRRVHAGLVRRRGRQARPVRPHRRGVDPERGALRRGLLGGDGNRPRHRPADHHQRVGGPARAEGGGGGRARDLRDLRRHPRDEEQPDRRDGGRGLPRLGLEVERGAAGGEHPGLSRPSPTTRRSPCSTWRCISPGALRSPTWTMLTGRPGCSAARFASRATVVDSPSRASSPPSTAPITAVW